jgi:NADH dehydrogenase FAD-containing subunit
VPDVPEPFAGAPNLVAAKFLPDAIALRRRLHVLRVSGWHLLRVVVVGAGITGVEWSAELAGGRVDGTRVATTLIGAEVRILPRFHYAVSQRAARRLSRLGVEMLTYHRVIRVARDHVVLEGNTSVPCDVIVWAGGVRPNPLIATLGLPLTPRGHLVVSPRLAVPGHDGIYAMGDCARIVDEGREWPTMERAIEAIWQGAYLARRFTAAWPADAGPPHRLRRDFFYGLSLGPRRSAIIYKRLCIEGRSLVWFRRWLQWAYYTRFRWIGWRAARRRAALAPSSAATRS